jgi:flagellar FliL protein
MSKKLIVFIVVGVVVLLLGIGGGVFVGLKFFGDDGKGGTVDRPGPMMPLGDFTVNLADPDPHIVRFKMTLELSSPKVPEVLADPAWGTRMKNEVLMVVKDRRYTDLKRAEGLQALGQDLRARLNAALPRVEGKVPITRVLFEEFMLQ